MYSKRIVEVLEDQKQRREAAKKRKERWKERNEDSDDGTRSEHVPNAHGIVLERSGSSSTSSSISSNTEVKEETIEEKVSIVTESEHLRRYVEMTGHNPHVHVHSLIEALSKYPIEEWEAHVQLWIDTPRWNERNAQRIVASFLETQEESNGRKTGRSDSGKLSARQLSGLGTGEKLTRMGYGPEAAATTGTQAGG